MPPRYLRRDFAVRSAEQNSVDVPFLFLNIVIGFPALLTFLKGCNDQFNSCNLLRHRHGAVGGYKVIKTVEEHVRGHSEDVYQCYAKAYYGGHYQTVSPNSSIPPYGFFIRPDYAYVDAKYCSVQFADDFSTKAKEAEKYCFHTTEIPKVNDKLLFLQSMLLDTDCLSMEDELNNWYVGLILLMFVVFMNGVYLKDYVARKMRQAYDEFRNRINNLFISRQSTLPAEIEVTALLAPNDGDETDV
jgi:hypothetical protein